MRKASRMDENAKTSTFTSARTLLAILRLSTALARLRLGDKVDKGDVMEAIRLMDMSKDTLKNQPIDKDNKRSKQTVDQIYDMIRTMADGARTIKIQEIRDR